MAEQFALGTDGLAMEDHHLIEDNTLDRVPDLPPVEKEVWLRDACFARVAEDNQEVTEPEAMQTTMMTGWPNPT